VINGDKESNTASSAGAVYVFERTGKDWSNPAYIKPTNTGAGDWFGRSVAMSADGGTLAVGAPNERSDATGVGAQQSDNSIEEAGAVYMFVRTDKWSQQEYIKASNTEAYDNFGQSVALSADGDMLAVGAAGEDSSAAGIAGSQTDNFAAAAGAVYMFTRALDVWSQKAYVKAPNAAQTDYFGHSVAVSGDGDVLAVGAFGEESTAIRIGGDQKNNTAPDAGAVYFY
ncbi:MAG TPA: hypothetical protein VGB85_11070, partial [Nannocystis sp.]